MRKISLFPYILWLSFPIFLYAQQFEIPPEAWKESGIPYIQNFSPKDYGENPQNWCIVQDDRGIMYFGNTHGVLVYDGVSWRLIQTANNYVVRSLCISKGRIYVGGQDELGYLAANASGQLEYISLLDSIPPEYQGFKDVWGLHDVGGQVYFQSINHIFRLSGGQFKAWVTESNRFIRSFEVGNRLYVYQENVGLLQMAGDSLQLVPGGQIFASDRVRVLLQYDASTILAGASTSGFYLYDGSGFTPFPTGADTFARQNGLYNGAMLDGGLIALSTLSGGVAIVDKTGHLCQVLNKAAGLRDERVYNIFKDRQGAMWLALNNGLARVEIPAPVTLFSAATGIESIVESMIRHRGTLYVGTHSGVYYLEENENSSPVFRPVGGISLFAWSMAKVGKYILVAGRDGVFQIENKKATLLKTDWGNPRALVQSQVDTNRVYAGLTGGLGVLQLINDRWVDLGSFPDISERMFDITEDKNGVLWLGTQYQGVLRVEVTSPPSPASLNQVKTLVTRFGQEQGVPESQTGPAIVGDKVVLATLKGLKRFDPTRQVFVPDSTFGEIVADTSCGVFRVREDERGNVWFTALKEKKPIIGQAVRHPAQPGSYIWQETPFWRLNNIGDIFIIHPEKDGIAWFGGSEGLARYNPEIPRDYAIGFPALVRRVIVNGDSVIYGGTSPPAPLQRGEPVAPPFEGGIGGMLPYAYNTLRFEFSASSYEDVSANQYQYMLEGFDERWSKWSTESKKDYTGLSEGDYIFRVRAKNIYNHLSKEARFEFNIIPPWYRSPWTYFLYVLLGGGMIFAIIKTRVRQLEKKSKELESIIAERTAQVVEQRNRLKEQSEKLQEMDKLKSRFFANISHEFRTPLTLILGLLDKFMNKSQDREDLGNYQVMKRNATRLMQLINQLLDLAKLEAGGIKLQAARGDIVRFMRRIILSFSSLGEQKNIHLTFNNASLTAESGHTPVYVYFDEDKLEKVFYNLLSNAFKFTPPEGRIDLVVSVGSSGVSGQIVEIRVANSGPGIPGEKLPYVFDRFYQADGGSTRQFEGTGIGLALVKELVELHRGQVAAESVEGEETAFTVRLPLGREHLKDEEIVEKEAVEAVEQSLLPEPDFVADSPAAAPGEVEREPGSEETLVLVVEDHSDLRMFIREHLSAEYKIVEAENGKIGLEKAEEMIPDLVISDIMMPEMDGYALCKALKTNEKTNHIPVILLTAKAAAEDKLEGLETGADDYLIKPFNPEELRVRVRNLIRLRQQMREKFSTEMLIKPSQITVPSTQKVFLERLTAVIEENIDNEDFSVEVLGQEMGMSRAQIHRKLRAITNQSASEFIRSFRLQRAAELIKQDAGNIAEIAYRVGFNSQAYFTRCFQEAFGCSPSEYKRREQGL